MSPGSVVARAHGCKCSVELNAYGLGMGCEADGPLQYVVALLCPIHGGKARGWHQPENREASHDTSTLAAGFHL